jgi:hypothetical protein
VTTANDPERTDPPRQAAPQPPLLASAWRAGGLYYLAACLAALFIGLNPQAIYPTRREILPAPLPALQCLAAVQALFFLLVHPLLMMWRADRRPADAGDSADDNGNGAPSAAPPVGPGEHWAAGLVESAAWLAATTPFYLAAAWLSDATATDVARSVLYAVALALVAWSAGTLMRVWRAACPVVLLLLLLAAALPAVYYIVREFFGVLPAEWLWDLAPATFAWQTAESRVPALIPHPLWGLLAWPALAAALGAVALLGPRRAGAIGGGEDA